MTRIAILDDYQGVAEEMADWSTLPGDVQMRAFPDHLAGDDALAERLADFDVVVGIRERTPFPRSLLQRLPKLKLLVTTGMANAVFDMVSATELGIVVSGTEGSSATTGELTWGSSSPPCAGYPRRTRLPAPERGRPP